MELGNLLTLQLDVMKANGEITKSMVRVFTI